MIEFIYGKIGGGKSLLATTMMREDFCNGLRVESNIAINTDYLARWMWRKRGLRFSSDQYRYHNFEEHPDFHNHIHRGSRERPVKVYVDEAQLYYNANDARELVKTMKELISFLTQSRRFGVDIVFITQDPTTVFGQFRKQALWGYECRDLRGVSLGWLVGNTSMLGLRWKKVDLGGSGQVLEKGKSKLDKHIFRLYDTTQFYDNFGQSLMDSMPVFTPQDTKKRKLSFLQRYFKKPCAS